MAVSETTQRAYTLTIATSEHDDLLERTHQVTNAGAASVLNWMLSLFGGMDASRGHSADARQILTRGWLSVESEQGAPAEFIVPSVIDKNGARVWQNESVIERVLAADGIGPTDREGWLAEVRPSICASLRDDAVWVDRRGAFEALVARVGSIDQADIDDFFFDCGLFQRERFFALDVKPEAPECIRGMGQWLSRRAGTGAGANFALIGATYAKIAAALDANTDARTTVEIGQALSEAAATIGPPLAIDAAIQQLTSGSGHKSRTKNFVHAALTAEAAISDEAFEKLRAAAHADAASCAAQPIKGSRHYSDAFLNDVAGTCGLAYYGNPSRHKPYSVMFDLAGRRFAGALSFFKNAERYRSTQQAKIQALNVDSDVIAWCDAFAAESGAIRPRSLGRFKEVIERWDSCVDVVARMDALRQVQKQRSREKLGNVNLFAEIAVAVDEAAELLRNDPRQLENYVSYSEARHEVTARKAPMLRHIDAAHSPVWVEFGDSRWPIVLTPTTMGAQLAISLVGLDGPTTVTLNASSSRFVRDLNLGSVQEREPAAASKPTSSATVSSQPALAMPERTTVSRGDRLGRLAAGAGDSNDIELAAARKHNGKLHFNRKSSADGRRWIFTYSANLGKRRDSPDLRTYLRDVSATNATRGTSVRRNLGRYPGMRILGVNTGLRAGAACAILETISAKTMNAIAKQAHLAVPDANDLSFRVLVPNVGAAVPKYDLYRRIGPDLMSDGTPHPCPWARIEQKFVIRLPGEKADDVRKASVQEIALVQEIAAMLGVATQLPRRVDELQASALRSLRRALSTHGRLAASTYMLRRYIAGEVNLERAALAYERLQAAAERDQALKMIMINQPPTLTDPTIAAAVAEATTAVWRSRDPIVRKAIKAVRRWIMPLERTESARGLGSLNLTRLSNLRAYRSASVAYELRARPDRPTRPDRFLPDFDLRCLRLIAQLRQERTRVLTSLIIDAALGGSRTPVSVAAGTLARRTFSERRDVTRSTERLYVPVNAVVLEDLSGFKPDQTRTRRENTTLRTWAHSDLRDQITAACELHGLVLRTVPAAYTSQEDGRTGAAAIRVTAVPVQTFVEAPWWREAIESALSKARRGTSSEEERLLLSYWSRWNETAGTWVDDRGRTWTRRNRRWTSRIGSQTSPADIVLPDVEGPLFISLTSSAPTNADTNAATNIACAMLLDPDWAGAFSHIATLNGTPLPEKVKGSACFRSVKQIELEAKGKTTIINAWRHRSSRPINEGTWLTTPAYATSVRDEIMRRLREEAKIAV